MLYTNATVITMDAHRRVLDHGALLVDDDRIAAVGPAAELETRYPHAPRRDLRRMVVMPGLVNTHVHLSQCLIRGIGDDLALKPWLLERIWPAVGSYTEEDHRTSAELCLLELMKSGTTTFLETFLEGNHSFDSVVEAVVRSGMRAGIARCVMDIDAFTGGGGEMHPGLVESREESIAGALALDDRWTGAGDGRIQIWFGPRPPGGTSESLLREMMQLARSRRMPVNMHLAEDLGRVAYIRDTFDGASPVELCERVGMLGPDVLLVHCVNITDDADIATIAATGTHVSHNPASNSKLGMGVAPLRRWLDAGVNVALGTDGGPCNNTYDLMRDFRWVSYLHKAVEQDATLVPAELVLEMATLHGAAALGLQEEIGSLEVGKKADFIAIDLDQPHFVLAPDVVSAIAWCALGSDVHTVVINGQVTVEGGTCTTLPEQEVLPRARAQAAAVLERAGITITPTWPHV